MSVQTQIDRLTAAKSAIVAAIAAKGVSVPSSALLDALDAYIAAIETGADVSGVTAAAADVAAGKKFVGADGVLRDGAMPSVTQATPSISVSSGGLITASATQSAGKVAAGTKSATEQLTTQGEKTVTPTASEQVAVPAGVFTTGAVKVAGVNNLPAKYTKLPYIESTGTQYIDTAFVPNHNTRIVCDVQITDTATRHLFGARASASEGAFFVPCISATTIRADYGSQKNTHTVDSVLERMTIDLNKTSCTIGGISTTFAPETFSANASIALFASNTNGVIVVDTYKAKMKLFSCRIYDNGTLVRDYIPCKRDDDGELGLYDIKNGVFYTNDGAGQFNSDQAEQGEKVIRGSYNSGNFNNYTSFIISNLSFQKIKEVVICISSIVIQSSSSNTILTICLRDGINVFTQYQQLYSGSIMMAKTDDAESIASYAYNSGVLTISVLGSYEFIGRADYKYVVVGE